MSIRISVSLHLVLCAQLWLFRSDSLRPFQCQGLLCHPFSAPSTNPSPMLSIASSSILPVLFSAWACMYHVFLPYPAGDFVQFLEGFWTCEWICEFMVLPCLFPVCSVYRPSISLSLYFLAVIWNLGASRVRVSSSASVVIRIEGGCRNGRGELVGGLSKGKVIEVSVVKSFRGMKRFMWKFVIEIGSNNRGKIC